MRVTHACQEAEARVQMLQKSLKRAIVKSKPYFELKAQFNQILEVKRLPWEEGLPRLLVSKGSFPNPNPNACVRQGARCISCSLVSLLLLLS